MPPKRKHIGDEVEGGVKCSEPGCSKVFKFVSSYGRHVTTVHGIASAKALGMVNAIRQQSLGNRGERFSKNKLCPVCKTGFSFKMAMTDHLKEKHDLNDIEVGEALQKADSVSTDRYASPVGCPKCHGIKKVWTRKSHLSKHLTKIHAMSAENANNVAANQNTDKSVGSADIDMSSTNMEPDMEIESAYDMNLEGSIRDKSLEQTVEHSAELSAGDTVEYADMNLEGSIRDKSPEQEVEHSAELSAGDTVEYAEGTVQEMDRESEYDTILEGGIRDKSLEQTVEQSAELPAEDTVENPEEIDDNQPLEPKELVWLNKDKESVVCHFCPVDRIGRTRLFRGIPLHLKMVHKKMANEQEEIIARLENSNSFESTTLSTDTPTVPYVEQPDNLSAEKLDDNDLSAAESVSMSSEGEHVEASGRNGFAKVNLKKRARPNPAQKKATVSCPICEEKLATKFAVIRHMKSKHEMSRATIDTFNIGTTTKPCKYCQKEYKNVWKHQEVCPQKVVATKRKVAKGCEPGGKKFLAGFKAYLENQLAKNVVRQYVGKAASLTEFWESRVEHFIMDKLLEPLHHNAMFPSLATYLNESQTVGDGNVAIKVYKYLVDFTVEVFNTRYGADPTFTCAEKKDWKRDTKDNKDDYDRKHKLLMKDAKRQTADNAADAQENGAILEFNPDRLQEVLKHILEHEKVAAMLSNLSEKTPEEIREIYSEAEVRYCLMGQLLVTTGKRSDAVAHLTVGGICSKGQKTDNGCWVVPVREHKTFTTYGSSLVTFETEELYNASLGYMHAFRAESLPAEYLFATIFKQPTQLREAIKWIKVNLLPGFCTTEEIARLSAKAFRKGFSNWGKDHPDQTVRDNVCEVQDHSQTVQETNYNVASYSKASMVTKAVMNLVRSRKPAAKTVGGSAGGSNGGSAGSSVGGYGGSSGGSSVGDSVGGSAGGSAGGSVGGSAENSPEQSVEKSAHQSAELPAGGKRKGRKGLTFSDEERSLLKKAFFINGEAPSGITNKTVELAQKKFSDLVPIVARLMEKNENKKSLVNNNIRKAMIKKKK